MAEVGWRRPRAAGQGGARRAVGVLAAGAVAAGLGGCGSSSSSSSTAVGSATSCGGADVGGTTQTTASYVMTAVVGPVEVMYSQDEVNAKHPTTGELMLGGSMSMPSSGLVRHLEVHICQRSGAVVTDAHPTIALADTAGSAPPEDVPVSVMEGVTSGSGDLHYGNNVGMTAGHTYTVTVRLTREVATFTVTP